MSQSQTKFVNGMDIHLLSFRLPKKIIDEKDDVRVSITSFPDGNKQHFSIECKKICNVNHVFSLNISNQTKSIVMVFRKKTFLKENPIIASSTIHLNEIQEMPKEQINEETICTDVKILNVYYPLQKQIRKQNKNERNDQQNENHNNNMKIQRKILGQMEVQFTFKAPYSTFDQNEMKKTKKVSKDEKTNKTDKNNHIEFKVPKTNKQEKKIKQQKLTENDNFYNTYLID